MRRVWVREGRAYGVIPVEWDTDQPCYAATSTQDGLREKHEGHRTQRDCYLATWKPPPLAWFKIDRPPRTRSWHLALGIRLDNGEAQTKCNVGHGIGPWLWREAPALQRHEEPGQWFCRRCVAEWTRRIQMATVTTGVTMSKHAFKALADKIEASEGVIEVELRMTAVENDPALIAELKHDGQRDGKWSERLLVVGDGVVKLT